MIDPVVARCDLCKTTDDIEPQPIAARRNCHLCGCCKRALYSIIDGPSDPALPDDAARGLASSAQNAWRLEVQGVQSILDSHLKQLRDAEETARQAELQAKRDEEKRLADEQAERDRLAAEAAEQAAQEAAATAAEQAAKDAAARAAADAKLAAARAAADAKLAAENAARDKAIADLNTKLDANIALLQQVLAKS